MCMFSALAFVYISGVCAYVCVGLCECGYVRVLVRGLVTLSSIFQVVSQFTKKSCPCLQKQLPSWPGRPTPHLPHVLWTLPTEPVGSEERPEASEVTTAVHGGRGREWPPGVVWYTAWAAALLQSPTWACPDPGLWDPSSRLSRQQEQSQPQHWRSTDPGREKKHLSTSFLVCQKQRFQEGAAAGRSLREHGTRIQVTGPLLFIQPSLLPAGAGFMHCSLRLIRAREPRPPRPKAQGTLKSCPGTEGQEARGTREVLTIIV